jgi:hypothetical protein
MLVPPPGLEPGPRPNHRVHTNDTPNIICCRPDKHFSRWYNIRMIVQCLYCKKEFDKSPSAVRTSPNHYCSIKCAAQVNCKLTTKRTVEGACAFCGKAISSSLKFCSRSCRQEATSVQYNTTLGEYRGRLTRRNFHINLREQSRREYRLSGRPFKCFCGYDKHVNICHIRAVKDFPDSALLKTVSHADNLVALCPNHHWEFDNGFLTL